MRRRQAYEKRQWTKSREAARLRCGGLYEDLIGTLMMTDGTSREEVEGTFKGAMPSPVWTSWQRTQPERAGTDFEQTGDLAAATVMDGSALPAIDALPSRKAISKPPRAAGYRASDLVVCPACSIA